MNVARNKVDFVAKARACWGSSAPDWVLILAELARDKTLSSAAARVAYSPATVSYVISNKYRGDLSLVEAKVRGALMGMTVDCPILGEIGRHRCLDEQKMGNNASSSIRSKLYRACRSGCPHSRVTPPPPPKHRNFHRVSHDAVMARITREKGHADK
jgi:hypothetical protein